MLPSGHSAGGAMVAEGQASPAGTVVPSGHSVGELVADGRGVDEPAVTGPPRVGEVDVEVDVGLALVPAALVVVVSVGALPPPQAVTAPTPSASTTATKNITGARKRSSSGPRLLRSDPLVKYAFRMSHAPRSA